MIQKEIENIKKTESDMLNYIKEAGYSQKLRIKETTKVAEEELKKKINEYLDEIRNRKESVKKDMKIEAEKIITEAKTKSEKINVIDEARLKNAVDTTVDLVIKG